MDMNQPVVGPRLPRREVWVDLPEEYPGFKFKMWVNAPQRVWNTIASAAKVSPLVDDATPEQIVAHAAAAAATTAAVTAALQKIVLEHNGWLDDEGQPFPPASDAAFWEAIPTELGGVVMASAQLAMGDLPNSLPPRKRR